jgi:hypothetical protein
LRSVGWLARWIDKLPPGAGASVMATAVVSVGLRRTGRSVRSAILLGGSAAAGPGLAAVFFDRALRDPSRFRREARSPAALTAERCSVSGCSSSAIRRWPMRRSG